MIRTLTLAEIAEACGVSTYHLAHAFGARIGLSVMQYVRGRRLTVAAQSMAAGAPDILNLALETHLVADPALAEALLQLLLLSRDKEIDERYVDSGDDKRTR